MFVSDVKESTKKQVQVNTSSEISEMVTFNKMGQAIQWVHATDYEKILQQNDFLKKELKETNNNWTDTITYYEKRLKGARKMVLDLRKQTPKSIAKGTLFLISELLKSEKEIKKIKSCLDEGACKICTTFLCPDNENPKATNANQEIKVTP
jgi:hypothetical protein